ncbi:helix-turn-helix transcriptional regulator [Rugosimonospora africana]|uniref:helix-turn-helix transcriptional regulator n=1 Tax=Rugosimonospora africana TaxID=556532 RepID=UPI001EF330B3|nr:AAA family ATPase [Rugosimonospora africana]
MTDTDGDRTLPTVRVPRLVGRDAELTRLRHALAGPPGLALVEGEAGIGKSRLVHELLAGRDRTMVAVCPPFREAFTLGPIVDAARQACTEVAVLGLSPLAGALRPLFPEWSAELPEAPEPLGDAGAARHRLLRSLAELLERLGVELLVVEDVHWADQATLEFLLFLVSRRDRRVGLVLTYRPEDVPPDSLLRRLSSRGQPVRVTLAPLDVAGTAELVSSMLDDEHVSAAFAAFLHGRTEGLPLAVEESVRLMRDRADLVRLDGEWIRRTLDDIVVPPTIRDAVLERAARLDAAARRVLQAAAVLAEPVGEATLIAVALAGGSPDVAAGAGAGAGAGGGGGAGAPAGLLPASADAGLIEAIDRGLLVEDDRGRIRFGHVLAARAVYDAVPGPDRRRLHARAGRVLEAAATQPVARLAHHFREAGEVETWCRYAERAADLALASGDHRVAVMLLHDMVTGADLPAGTLARVVRKMPTLASSGYLRRSGVVGTLRGMLDRAALSVPERAELRAQLGRVLMHAGEYEAGAAMLELAIPDLGHKPVEAAYAMSTLGLPFSTAWPAPVHRQWLDRAAAAMSQAAVSQAEPTTAATTAATMTAATTTAFPEPDRLALRIDRMTALLDLGDPEGWQVAAELPVTANETWQRPHVARAALNIGNEAMRWGRYAEARRRLAVGVGLAEEYDLLRLSDMIAVTLVHLDWFTGAWTGLADRAAALAELDGEALIRLDAKVVGGLLDAATGAPRRAETALRAVLDEARERGMVELLHEPAAALARIRLADGDVDAAIDLTEQVLALVAGKEIWLWASETAAVRVDALSAAGRLGDAYQLVSSFERGLRGCDAPVAAASLATCRGCLAEATGDRSAAAAAFAAAALAWDGLPRPYDALLARERQGMNLIAAGDLDAGLAVLGDVPRGLSGLGATGDADRVAAVLRGHGVTARRPWRGGSRGYGDQLSPRELEVVRLVVAGLTNPEIARALSRSPKTVAAQLTSAMRKLGVSSRTAVAVSATQAGIVTAGDSD